MVIVCESGVGRISVSELSLEKVACLPGRAERLSTFPRLPVTLCLLSSVSTYSPQTFVQSYCAF